MTSLKAPNNANAEALDFDNQILEQIRDPASLNAATVTVLRAAEPCNKKISLNDTTGALEKIPLASITYAEVRSYEIADVASLRSLLEKVSEHHDLAITLCSFNGIPTKEPFTILSARMMRERLGLPESSATPDKAVQFDGKYYTTREKKNCIPSSWACFDYDKVKGMPEKLIATSPEDWLRMMGNLVPGFNEADKVFARSSSSRISYHDAPAFDGGWHCFVQVKDADDVENFGKRLLIHSLTTEYGFMRKIFSSDTGEVVGYRPWTIFDPTTFSRERLLFEGKPVVDGRGLDVFPADIQIIGGKMRQLDTSLLKVTSKNLGHISTQYGLTVSGSNGSMSLINNVDLKLDTEFDTEHDKMSLEQFKDSNHQKLRCQAKFRPDSSSWNGYLGKHKDGSPFHYDNGTHIKYVIPKPLIAKGLWSKHKRPLTDTGNAERFVDLANDYCRYISELTSFIVFMDDIWGYASVSTIELATKTVARSILNEAAACSSELTKPQLISWQKYSESRSGRKNMLELVKGEISLPFSKIDENKNLIGCKNGVVDLQLQTLIPSNPDNFIVSKMSASFDPEATAPRFEKFIDEVTSGDKQVATYIQVVFGMMLLGKNPKQIMLMLIGLGSNGKSLLLEIMLDIFGDYGISVEPELFLNSRNADSSRPRPEVVKLAGKRLCITSEPPKGLGLNENLIKRLTGNDTLSARIPYAKEEVSFRPNVVPIMSSNHDVRIEGTDHGIWRRIKQVPFNVQFEPNKEKGLDQKLLSERDGIFNWLLEGVKMFLNDGLSEPQVIADNTKCYRASQDVISEWITDCCLINQGDEKQKVLYSSYLGWCKSNNYKPLESRDLHAELRGKGHDVDRSRNGKPVIGLKLK